MRSRACFMVFPPSEITRYHSQIQSQCKGGTHTRLICGILALFFASPPNASVSLLCFLAMLVARAYMARASPCAGCFRF